MNHTPLEPSDHQSYCLFEALVSRVMVADANWHDDAESTARCRAVRL